jgi:hypothetical protein
VFVEYNPFRNTPLVRAWRPLLMSNVVNFDRQERLHTQQVEQQRKIAEHAIDRAKDEWKRLAQMEQQQR